MRDFRREINMIQGAYRQSLVSLKEQEQEFKTAKLHKRHCEEVLTIIQVVGEDTQQEFVVEISQLVSKAMREVFDDPYELEIEFVSRRNTSEADLYFTRNGEKVKPMESTGGGAVDMAGFTLRITFLFLWIKYVNPKTPLVLFLDEPLRCLSKSYLASASSLIRELADSFGLQIIMITHLEELSECCSKKIQVAQKKGVSYIVKEKEDEFEYIQENTNSRSRNTKTIPNTIRRTKRQRRD